ncbi:DUF3667 domain-containing protein [Geojedonia litorea]|uniref:DUF3667 domain-containing protein n=1 Tax=Geojedonia litorea TaxID=1268269 RepID=A0ABV9N127_9FLAO
MTKPTVSCANCEKEFEEGFDFCPHCGQKSNDDLTIGVLFYNTISNYFSFDARFFKSFVPLMFRPGYLAKKFLEGKRLLFLHPAQMYLFISVIFFFILSFTVSDIAEKADSAMQKDKLESLAKKKDSIEEIKPVLDSLEIQSLMKPLKQNQKILGLKDEDLKIADSIIKTGRAGDKTYNTTFNYNERSVDSLIAINAEDNEIYQAMGMDEDAGYLTRKFYGQLLKFHRNRGASSIIMTFFNSIPIAMFFLLPLFALLLKIFYFNKGRYAHHLVFSFYYFSFLFMVFSIIFGLNRIWEIPDWIDWLVALSTFMYLFLALKNFYSQHWFWTLFKSGVISFTFLMMVIPTTIILLVMFSFLFY